MNTPHIYEPSEQEEINKLKENLKQAKQTIRNMRNVLADLEWTTESVPPNACPWCLQYNPGHDVTCGLKKVINNE